MLHTLRSSRWLFIVCTAGFLSSSGMGLTNPVLSLYARGFGVSTSLVGFFITTFAIGRVLVTIPAGRAADRWGRRKLLLFGALIIAAGSFALASAATFPQLLLFRLLQGVGSAFYMSAALLVIADRASVSERGRSNALFQGSILLGLTVSPIIGGALASSFGIRAPFYMHATLSTVTILFAWRWFPTSLLSHTSRQPTTLDDGTSAEPSLTRTLLSDHNFVLISLAAFMIFVARAGSRDTILPLLSKETLALSTTALGFLFTLISLLNLLAIPIAGWAADRFGRKLSVILGLVLMGLSLGILAAAPSYTWFLIAATLMGMGKGFGEPTSIVYVTDIALHGKFGGSFGLFLTLRDLGLFIGPVLLGWLADYFNLQLPLIFNGAAMLAVAVLFALFAKETLPRFSTTAKGHG